MNLIESYDFLTPNELSKKKHSRILSLKEILSKKIYADPINKEILEDDLRINKFCFDLFKGSAILFPRSILDNMINWETPLKYYSEPLIQYHLLSQIKGKSDINAPSYSRAANKHFFRIKKFCENLDQGLLLDVGCDRPSLSSLFYPEGIDYHGIDPSFSNDEFKTIGMAEFLPFVDLSFDYVSFNTSLDHILDYHTAIQESYRVLKKKGNLIIASYVWKDKATLLKDNVHFHHFREYEIFGALEKYFSIEKSIRYEDPKGETHRYGIYIMAKKKL